MLPVVCDVLSLHSNTTLALFFSNMVLAEALNHQPSSQSTMMSLHLMEQLMMRGIEVDKERKKKKPREVHLYRSLACECKDGYDVKPVYVCVCVCSKHAPKSLCFCTCKHMCIPVWVDGTNV